MPSGFLVRPLPNGGTLARPTFRVIVIASTFSRESTEQFAGLVYCLIEDQLVNSSDWTRWAAVELMSAEGAPVWLAELTTTYSTNDALNLIAPVCGRPSSNDRLGCLWLAFAKRHITSVELLETALDAAGGWDTGGSFIPHQRELMNLMRRLESLQDATHSDSFGDIERDTFHLLRPLGQEVMARSAGRIVLSQVEASQPAR
jgi:hypothetical protein